MVIPQAAVFVPVIKPLRYVSHRLQHQKRADQPESRRAKGIAEPLEE